MSSFLRSKATKRRPVTVVFTLQYIIHTVFILYIIYIYIYIHNDIFLRIQISLSILISNDKKDYIILYYTVCSFLDFGRAAARCSSLGTKFLAAPLVFWQASALKESFQEPCGEAGVASGASG